MAHEKPTIEQIYRKKNSLRSTILHNPATYIGSTEKKTETLWIYDGAKMVRREVSYVRGLLHIFDEILINAADNRQRHPPMTSVIVKINTQKNLITVRSNGLGIPIMEHKEEDVYVPEMLFGQLSTSSNYGDKVIKTIVGRRGYGAKLTNIFSTEFTITIFDGEKKYNQMFGKNMTKTFDPTITDCKSKESWTEVSFKPDLKRFNIDKLDDGDMVDVLRSRVYSFAACLGKAVKVTLNDKLIKPKSFSDYVALYPDHSFPRIIVEVKDKWEVCVTASEGRFEDVSFVNSVATIGGGTHVDYVVREIKDYIENTMKLEKNANTDFKEHLRVFVNARIDNPKFDPLKERLTLGLGKFGSKREISNALKKGNNSRAIKKLLSRKTSTQNKEGGGEFEKNDGTKIERLQIEKLHDAKALGSSNCTLILTEGDSAKSLAMAGLSVLGKSEKRTYGVYPLQGKLRNVRARPEKFKKNRELENIKRIIGLNDTKSYTTTNSLRYKHVMIMTDQDHDGDHIKGLLINFFHYYWPGLLKVDPPFLSDFRTPIMKVTKGGEAESFYSMFEFSQWKDEQPTDQLPLWETKYYKGLGTSTSAEGEQYFSNLDFHKRNFVWDGNDTDTGKAIELAFGKLNSGDRRQLLQNYNDETHQGTERGVISIKDFMEKKLVSFFNADLQRSIPSMIDGLKTGQRKILYSFLERSSNKAIKASEVAALVSQHTVYHHGDKCLYATAIRMGQNHVGSNNMPLLQSIGQFGTRKSGGKDAANAIYLQTNLSPLTKLLFRKDEFARGKEKEEPSWYFPIIPTILVNGCQGVGTGWSSSVPNYNITDIISNLENLINGGKTEPMVPWYRGFKGSIKEHGDNRFITAGELEIVNSETRLVTELPIKVWTDKYEKLLDRAKENRGKLRDVIKDYKNSSNGISVNIKLKLKKAYEPETPEDRFAEKQELQLTSTILTSNMHLFNDKGEITKYESPQEIIQDFYKLRLRIYASRKENMEKKLKNELKKLSVQIKFLSDLMDGRFVFDWQSSANRVTKLKETYGVEYCDFLHNLPVSSYSEEKLHKLEEKKDKVSKEIKAVADITPEQIWLNELQELRKVAKAAEAAKTSSAKPVESQEQNAVRRKSMRLEQAKIREKEMAEAGPAQQL